MATKIPLTKNEAFAQLDEILSEKEKSELKLLKRYRLWEH